MVSHMASGCDILDVDEREPALRMAVLLGAGEDQRAAGILDGLLDLGAPGYRLRLSP